MQANQKLRQFQVALLMDDISEAKELSDTLRDLGIYAYYYDSLDEYWVAANAETPDLTIIDIKKMSSGTMLFKNHPKVKGNALCYAFYYKDETKVLLSSTYGLNHYGYIRKEVNLVGQIQSILRRRNEELHLIEQNIQLADRVSRLQKRSQRLINDAQISYNFENQYQSLMDVTERIGQAKNKDEFIKNLSNVFSEWNSCVSYGVYSLTANGQKLISPKLIRPKYKQMPQLWLNRPCLEGIADYAIEMAEEVAFDSLQKTMRVIKIAGSYDNPDLIIVAKFDEEHLQDFQWQLFEERLSNRYRQQLLKGQMDKTQSTHEIDIWEAFSYLDDIHFHQARSTHKLFMIDFSNLLNAIKEKHGNRFYWKSFFADFNEELSAVLSGNYKMSLYGAQSVLLFFDRMSMDVDYHRVKAFVGAFEFWRYFEDSSLMMTEQMMPELKAVAPSSVNYIRQTYADILNAGAQNTRRHQNVWEQRALEV